VRQYHRRFEKGRPYSFLVLQFQNVVFLALVVSVAQSLVLYVSRVICFVPFPPSLAPNPPPRVISTPPTWNPPDQVFSFLLLFLGPASRCVYLCTVEMSLLHYIMLLYFSSSLVCCFCLFFPSFLVVCVCFINVSPCVVPFFLPSLRTWLFVLPPLQIRFGGFWFILFY